MQMSHSTLSVGIRKVDESCHNITRSQSLPTREVEASSFSIFGMGWTACYVKAA